MSYTSIDAARHMMDTLAQEEEDFEASFDAAEGRFARAERSFNTWDLGDKRVHYRCNTTIGAFQLKMSEMSRYEHIPVLWFDTMIPYEFKGEGDDFFFEMRRNKFMDVGANYAEVEVSKDDDGKVIHCMLTIPYDDACIREIKIESDTDDASPFYDLADRINSDRRAWLGKAEFDMVQKNRMQVRNLGDMATATLKAAVTGGDVTEVVKKGIDTANDIEEGKVKQGFFGKLFKK